MIILYLYCKNEAQNKKYTYSPAPPPPSLLFHSFLIIAQFNMSCLIVIFFLKERVEKQDIWSD